MSKNARIKIKNENLDLIDFAHISRTALNKRTTKPTATPAKILCTNCISAILFKKDAISKIEIPYNSEQLYGIFFYGASWFVIGMIFFFSNCIRQMVMYFIL